MPRSGTSHTSSHQCSHRCEYDCDEGHHHVHRHRHSSRHRSSHRSKSHRLVPLDKESEAMTDLMKTAGVFLKEKIKDMRKQREEKERKEEEEEVIIEERHSCDCGDEDGESVYEDGGGCDCSDSECEFEEDYCDCSDCEDARSEVSSTPSAPSSTGHTTTRIKTRHKGKGPGQTRVTTYVLSPDGTRKRGTTVQTSRESQSCPNANKRSTRAVVKCHVSAERKPKPSRPACNCSGSSCSSSSTCSSATTTRTTTRRSR